MAHDRDSATAARRAPVMRRNRPVDSQHRRSRRWARGLPDRRALPDRARPRLARLPVLMDPYGGPHMQTVVRASRAYLEEQWIADQGFVVIVGRRPRYGRSWPGLGQLARNDFVGTIDDQVEVLHEVAAVPRRRRHRPGRHPGLVVRGYVAALGVLKHPAVFGAAVAGAP